MITPGDYAEWYKYAGLVSPHLTSSERYAAQESLLSPAGRTTLILARADYSGGDMFSLWIGFIALDEETLPRLAAAFREIGAERAAAQTLSMGTTLVENANVLSPLEAFAKRMEMVNSPEPSTNGAAESTEEVRHLLEQFAAAHQKELEADIARHGDVRRSRRFNARKRRDELDARWRSQRLAAAQPQAVDEFRYLMGKLRQEIENRPRHPEKSLFDLRRELIAQRDCCEKIPRSQRTTELCQCLAEVQEFLKSSAEHFRAPLTQDAALESRLTAIGPYESYPFEECCSIAWSLPPGFERDWMKLDVRFELPSYERYRDRCLTQLLDACEQFRDQIAAQAETIRTPLLQQFAEIAGRRQDVELEDFARDGDGRITEASILEHAGTGRVTFLAEGSRMVAVHRSVFFPVAWDEEHGFEIDLDEDE